MEFRLSVLMLFLLFAVCFGRVLRTAHGHGGLISNGSVLPGIELTDGMGFGTDTGCGLLSGGGTGDGVVREPVKVHLRRRPIEGREGNPGESASEFMLRDMIRIQTLHRRISEKKNGEVISRLQDDEEKERSKAVLGKLEAPAQSPQLENPGGRASQMMATLASGVSLGSGEYFMDVFIGTPPKHLSLILDTGSDLNWVQCVPCYACFEQNGPYYNPDDSTSYRNITCHDPRCQLVSSPSPRRSCEEENQSCPYFYWYGDSSNTTGDFALEAFTVNLTSQDGKSKYRRVENVMFGCGHWNRGLFHGAAGLLGLGRGALSFSSQLQSIYGHSFSYCLVDRNSDSSVSSKLIFGEDKDLLSHPNLNFTSFVEAKENPVDTFYYIQVKSILVGGVDLKIPEETWKLSSDGSGGTIIDSGTTLSYFADPAYNIIREAFLGQIKSYPLVKDIEILNPCYNISGVGNVELPEFTILFADGAVWDFPVENYFITLIPNELVCLAVLGTPRSGLSIIGNYQQQNFHILYDTKRSRLGYAPMRCADI
ncbi:hypothetical protein MLD38_033274 [Melastoma candidum]|uniref:Uncharacterized protein n=1 Tax=Melastoma candidum TaxID=119954 RepID=A0ACB9M6C7_9MYRT|nr:hypothetical protein MLD38_033274 [Melastoma candidum]